MHGIAGMLSSHGKNGGLAKASPLQIHATVTSRIKGDHEPDFDKFERDEIKRLKAEIKGIDKVLDEWVPEDVAAKAKRSLELDRDAKLARLAECKIRLKQHEVENSDEKSEEDEY